MKKIWTIAYRDLKAYFASPIGYIVIALVLAVMGFMFFQLLSVFNLQNLRYNQFNMGKGMSIADGIVRPLYGNMNVVVSLIMVPAITMRLFAEERKLHTLELLITSPVTLTQIVLGKFVAAFLFTNILLALTFVYPVVLFLTGTPDSGPIVGSYIGTLLMISACVSVGLLFSAMTENQIVAYALTLVTVLFFWIFPWASQSAGSFWGEILQYISLIDHYDKFSRGLVISTDVIYFLTFIGIGLFLTHRTLDSYRWR